MISRFFRVIRNQLLVPYYTRILPSYASISFTGTIPQASPSDPLQKTLVQTHVPSGYTAAIKKMAEPLARRPVHFKVQP